jgi:putative peptidoglycan lipid II flippase
MDLESSIVRSARSFFAGTLLSRIMGMGRDIAMACCFGSAPEVAAFMVAYRVANLFRRLFGEGNLQGAFVPQFEQLRMQGEGTAALFYRDLFFSIVAALALLIGVSGFVCWAMASVLNSEIPMLMMIMMPGVIFLSLYALNTSVLQCQKRFFLPALAPAAFNAVWIVAALLLTGYRLKMAMFGLSFGVLGSFAMQWWVISPPVMKWVKNTVGWRAWFRPQLFSGEVRRLMKPLSFGIVGIGAAQINSAVDAIFARLADPSGPAYLWYAIRIQQLPLALFGIALSGALLPPLSRAIQSGLFERYRELLQKGLKQSAALMIPCSVGLFVLATPGLDLLFGRGGFQESDVANSGICLQAYAVGLIPMVYILLLANGFYAQKEYQWPMRCSLVSVGCNMVLNGLFVFGFHWGAASIAIATVLSAFLNCSMLARGLAKRIGPIALWRGNGRIALAAVCAGALGLAVDQILPHQRGFLSQLSRMILMTGTYASSLFSLAWLLKAREVFMVLSKNRPPQS